MQRATSEGDVAGQSRRAMATAQTSSTSSGNSDSDHSDPVDETAAVLAASGGQCQKQKAQPSPQLPPEATHSSHATPSAKSTAQAAQAAQSSQTSQTAQTAQTAHPQQPAHHPPPQSTQKTTSSTAGPSNPRPRGQKRIVGGSGSTARLHARVPSSKALHKAVQHHQHHMHHVASTTSSAKLPQQRRPLSLSPPPVDFAAQFPFAAPPPTTASSSSTHHHHHRRSTSGSDGIGNGKLARSSHSSSATSLPRKNASSTNLKRNRSTADVSKRTGHGFVVGHGSRPTAQLKRSYSHPAVIDKQRQLQAAKNSAISNANNKASHVRFEIGSPDAQDDEWVDAGSSTLADSHRDSLPRVQQQHRSEGIPSRRASEDEDDDEDHNAASHAGVSPQHQNRKQKELVLPLRPANGTSNHNSPRTASTGAGSSSNNPASAIPALADEQDKDHRKLQRAASSSSTALHLLASNSKTRLLLPRTPSRGAPPKMSTETASATTNHARVSSTDSSSSPGEQQPQSEPEQSSAVSNNDRQQPPDEPPNLSGDVAGSSNDQMTSRFITAGSHESVSGAAGEGSFYTTSSSRPGTGRQAVDDQKSATSSNTPASAASGHHSAAMSHLRRSRSIGDDAAPLTDDEESPVLVAASSRPATASGGNPRRTRLQQAPPAELSRTQQKLNLERASSSLDRNTRPHQGPAAGPLLGAGGFGVQDPRIGKHIEKAGMEYNVVRRYQNPVTRSLARITSRVGGDKNWHIPAVNGNRSSTSDAAGATGRAGGRSGAGLSQSFRERDIRREAMHHSAVSAAAAHSGAIPGLSRTRTMPVSGTAAEADGNRSMGYGNGANRSWRLSGSSLVDGEEEDGTAALLRNLWDKNLYLGTSQE